MLLKPGDKVAVIAPSSCIEKESENKGVAFLQQKGFVPVRSKHLYMDDRYKTSVKRNIAAELNSFYLDSEIKALFCVRGGAGSLRILDFLDFDVVKNNPKPVFGLSDSTALQNALWHKAGVVSHSGFLLNYDFKNGSLDKRIEDCLDDIFSGTSYTVQSGKTIIPGKTKGRMVGGNLSVFVQLCGTKYFPDLAGKILFLEDCNEKTYKLDLMLSTVKMQPGFNQIAGIVLGQFTGSAMSDDYDGTIEQILEEFLQDVTVPVISDFAYGHIPSRFILPVGGMAELDADKALLKISG